MNNFTLHLGDCLDSLRGMADNSVDSIVTDPPYGLSFMGKKWDYDVPSQEIWAECLRVLKPGGHLLAFAGTRTQHRMAVRIEDAGFEIRDMIFWCYGSGFPKSHDVSKAIDREAGAERPDAIKGGHMGAAGRAHGDDYINHGAEVIEKTIPAIVGKGALTRGTPQTEAAKQWQGWGSALKPSLEPVTVARKPLIGTLAANVLAHGTGALNIDSCRVGVEKRPLVTSNRRLENNTYAAGLGGSKCEGTTTAGRWPANLIHDGSDEVLAGFPEGGAHGGKGSFVQHAWAGRDATEQNIERSTGSAARFFKQVSHDTEDMETAKRFMYCAKASKRDRDEGLEGFEEKNPWDRQSVTKAMEGLGSKSGPRKNVHPTVKPTDLMRYLCRLVTPPGGVVLDPFMGSGSTGKAAIREGFDFIGCEMSPEYLEIARARIQHEVDKRDPAPATPAPQLDLFSAA